MMIDEDYFCDAFFAQPKGQITNNETKGSSGKCDELMSLNLKFEKLRFAENSPVNDHIRIIRCPTICQN